MSGYAFHPDAFADLDEIWEYIAQDNLDAARQTRSRLGVGNLSRTQKSATDGCDPSGPTVDRQYASHLCSHTAKSGVPNDGELNRVVLWLRAVDESSGARLERTHLTPDGAALAPGSGAETAHQQW